MAPSPFLTHPQWGFPHQLCLYMSQCLRHGDGICIYSQTQNEGHAAFVILGSSVKVLRMGDTLYTIKQQAMHKEDRVKISGHMSSAQNCT